MEKIVYKFKDGHTIVVGLTQSGKTYAVTKCLLNDSKPVLFFNVQQEDLKGYVRVNKHTPFRIILKLLRLNRKINYIPDSRLKAQGNEITFLINQLFEFGCFSKKRSMYIVIDEAHLFEDEALENIRRIATSGIRWGLNGIFISQRPANLHNTLMTQSSHMLIFKTNMETQYFKNYNIPIFEILKLIDQNGKYSFCEYDFLTIKSYKKL
jgi:hypothetical protein